MNEDTGKIACASCIRPGDETVKIASILCCMNMKGIYKLHSTSSPSVASPSLGISCA